MQILSFFGVGILLVAFILLTTGRITPVSKSYLWLNVVGGAILAITSYFMSVYAFVLLETIWVASAIYQLLTFKKEG